VEDLNEVITELKQPLHVQQLTK